MSKVSLTYLLVAIGCLTLSACGNAESSEDGGDGLSNSPPPPGGTVSPAGLELEFIEGRDMELVALTLHESSYGPELLVAMRNPGPEYLCEVELQAAFGTTSATDMAELGGATLLVMGTMHETPEVMNCVGPGEIGFGGTDSNIFVYNDVSDVGRVYYQFRGYLYPAATKANSVSIAGLTTGPYSSSGTTLRGSVRNVGTVPVFSPEVQVFALNDVGRPLAQAYSYEFVELPPGSGWSFEVSVPGPFATHAAFFNYADQ